MLVGHCDAGFVMLCLRWCMVLVGWHGGDVIGG